MMNNAFYFISEALFVLRINESQYIALSVVNGFMKKLFLIDYVNIYLFSLFFSIDFARWKVSGYPTLLISRFIINKIYKFLFILFGYVGK